MSRIKVIAIVKENSTYCSIFGKHLGSCCSHSHCTQCRSGRKRSRSPEEERDNSEAVEQTMPVDFQGIVNLAVCQSSVTLIWRSTCHIQPPSCRHSSKLPLVVTSAAAFVASVAPFIIFGARLYCISCPHAQ